MLVVYICLVCKGDEETVTHALVSCPAGTQCWQWILPEVQRNEGDELFH